MMQKERNIWKTSFCCVAIKGTVPGTQTRGHAPGLRANGPPTLLCSLVSQRCHLNQTALCDAHQSSDPAPAPRAHAAGPGPNTVRAIWAPGLRESKRGEHFMMALLLITAISRIHVVPASDFVSSPKMKKNKYKSPTTFLKNMHQET